MAEITWHASGIGEHRLRGHAKQSYLYAAVVRLSAAVLIVLQEGTRFLQALRHAPSWLFWRVDWHFGKYPGWVERKKRNTAIRAVCYIAFWVALLSQEHGLTTLCKPAAAFMAEAASWGVLRVNPMCKTIG